MKAKKQKRIREKDRWNLTVEEQMKMLEDSDFDYFYENNKSSDNSIIDQIENIVTQTDAGERRNSSFPSYKTLTKTQHEKDNEKPLPEINDGEWKTFKEYEHELPKVKELVPEVAPVVKITKRQLGIDVDMKKELGQLTINDGVMNCYIQMNFIDSMVHLDDTLTLDMSDYDNYISILYLYFITTRHPVMIYTIPEFKREFGIYKKLNSDRFVFFSHGNYVFAYYISTQACNDIFNYIMDYIIDAQQVNESLNDRELRLKYMIDLCTEGNRFNGVFPALEETYITAFKDIATNENKKDYESLIANDDGTEFLKHEDVAVSVFENMCVLDYTAIQTEARGFIDHLTGDDEEDDDDDEMTSPLPNIDFSSAMQDDDDDEDEEDDDEDDEKEDSSEEESDDEDDLVIPGAVYADVKAAQEPEKKNDISDGNFTIPVIRKS